MDFHSMKRKELQALCKKHKIPANLTNLEMANSLTSLLKGKDKFFTGRRSCLKALDENGSENEPDVENKRVKKVRFSPETQMIEFQKSEAEVLEAKRRGRLKSVINEVSVAENVGGLELSEGVGHVTRSRGRRLVEEGVAEREGGKRGVKDDALGNSLPSADVDDNESRVVTRRTLGNRKVVDEGKRKNENMEKGSKKNGRQTNLRQVNVKGNDDVSERGESDVECVEVKAEKVLRRSKRDAMKVEDYRLLCNGMIATKRSIKPEATAVSEGSGPSGVDINAAMVEKESSPVGMATRRSRRNASRHEPLITLDHLVANAMYKRKMKKQRRDHILEAEAAEVDIITIETPLRRSSRNVNRSEKAAPAVVARKVAQKEKRKSKRQTEEIQDSFPEGLTTKDLPIDQSDSTDSKGIQVWVELSIGKQPPSRPASPDHVIEDEGICSEKSQECIEHEGLETVHDDVLEKYGNASPNGPCERDGFTSSVKDKTCEEDPANSEDAMTALVSGFDNFRKVADPNYNDDRCSTLNSPRALEPSMQTNGCEVDNVAGERNFDQEKLKRTKSAKSDEHNPLEENYDTSDRCCESNIPEPSRSVASMLEDGNVNSGEDPKEPADSQGEHLVSLSIAANAMETDCTRIESSTGVSSLGSTTIPLEFNLTLEDPELGAVSRTIFKSGQSFLEDTNVQKQEGSVDEMHLKKHLEPRKRAPSIQRNGVGSDDFAEAEKHFTDAKSSAELPKFDEEENILGKFRQSNAFDSSGRKLGMLGDPDINAGKDFVGDSDSQALVLAAPDFAAQSIEEEYSSSMKLDISLEHREHSPIVHRNGCEADSVADVGRNYDQVELNCVESSKSVEETPLEETYHSPSKCSESIARSISQDGEDSIKCQKNATISRKTYEDGNAGLTYPCISEKCISAQNDNNCRHVSVNSEYPLEAVISGTGNFAHIPRVDNNEHAGSRNSDIALEQRKHSPILQTNGCEADNAAEADRGHDQVELYCDESAESVEDRCLDERYHSPNECLESSVSDSSRRSAGRMLQDEIVSGGEDSIKHQEKSNEDTPEDGNAGSVESSAIDKYTTTKNHEDNPENSKDAMEEISGTGIFAHIPVVDKNEDYISTMNSEITLERREQSPAMQKNCCETDNVAEEDGNDEYMDLMCDEFAKSVEDRSSEEQCHSPDKCWESRASDPSGRILEDRGVNTGEDFTKSADMLGTSIVSPSLAAKKVERNCSATEFSASISNFGSTDPLDSSHTLDGPEFKKVSGDVNKSGHSTFPDKSGQKQDEIMDAMEQSSSVVRNSFGADDVAEAYKSFEEIKNCVELASFERGNNDAEDVVDVRKFQGVVFAVQSCASYVIEVSDTCAEGIHSPPSDSDAQQQGFSAGDETFAEDRKKEDSDEISEKISDFESTGLPEAKFTLNFKEELSCKDKEDNAKDKRENLAATFSQVPFTMSEIHNEEKIVEDIPDDVASKLYKHHEILKESDVADTINEYIDSESTWNPSLRIDDTSDTLPIGMLTKVAEPEAKNAEETIDITARKFEPSVEGDDQEKVEAADLAETATGSAWISESKTTTIQSKNSDVVADENSFLGKHFKSEMREKNIRAILIHGTPKKLQMAADMKENVPSYKMEKIGSLTTVKPATKRPALKDLLQK